jgi:hypothetical protein
MTMRLVAKLEAAQDPEQEALQQQQELARLKARLKELQEMDAKDRAARVAAEYDEQAKALDQLSPAGQAALEAKEEKAKEEKAKEEKKATRAEARDPLDTSMELETKVGLMHSVCTFNAKPSVHIQRKTLRAHSKKPSFSSPHTPHAPPGCGREVRSRLLRLGC